jgi:uncharacterized membrane protein
MTVTTPTRAPVALAATFVKTAATGLNRLDAIDLVRGIAMVLMAIDHVRVYSGLPAGGPTAGLFFTRWVTHFVAPAFVFLAGTAAYLHGRRLEQRATLSRFLVVRGLWLVLLELTVIRIAWTFNLDFASYMLAGVIWMIGWCMVLLAAAIHLPLRAIAVLAVAIIALHNVTDQFGAAIQQRFGDAGPPAWLQILYFGGGVPLGDGGPPLLVLFVIVPWIGVMMAGCAYGRVMDRAPDERRRFALVLGVSLCLLFVLLRGLDVYGDPRPWHASRLPGVLAFLNTTKYPASLSFLLMTLGPMFVLLGLAERWHGAAASVLTTFGRVPMFYYLLHIPVIHGAAVIVSAVREGSVNPWLFGNHPMAPPPVPDGYAWSLGLLYLVFVASVAILYVPCHWFARQRAQSRSRWLSYL